MTPDFIQYFLDSNSSVVQLRCFRISHSSFSEDLLFVQNATKGITARHEGGGLYFYKYLPVEIERIGIRSNLDFGVRVSVGDQGSIIEPQLKAARAYDNMQEKPLVEYRIFRSDNLDQAMYGPIKLYISELSEGPEGFTFEALGKSISNKNTGIQYSINKYPTLKGFL